MPPSPKGPEGTTSGKCVTVTTTMTTQQLLRRHTISSNRLTWPGPGETRGGSAPIRIRIRILDSHWDSPSYPFIHWRGRRSGSAAAESLTEGHRKAVASSDVAADVRFPISV